MKWTLTKYFFFLVILAETIECLRYEDLLNNIDPVMFEKVSPDCQNNIKLLNSSSVWAKVAQASGNLTTLSQGHFISMGNYDMCNNILNVATKYCKAFIKMRYDNIISKYPKQATYVCVLDSCTAEDLNILFPTLSFSEDYCLVTKKLPLDIFTILLITALRVYVVFVILVTFYSLWLSFFTTDHHFHHSILAAFSVYHNLKTLFDVQFGSLSHLNGLKFLSMLWIVIIHSYMSYFDEITENLVDVHNWMNATKNQPISEASVIVDSFLVIGGVIITQLYNTAIDKKMKIHYFQNCLQRYYRFTASLVILLLINVVIVKHLGSGPFWNNVTHTLIKPCQKYWWSVLLYLQNYNPNKCIIQTWYLSVDMQLFLISPIILFFMRFFREFGNICLSVLSAISIIISFATVWSYELAGTVFENLHSEKKDIFLKSHYFPTHIRIVPYFFGIMLYSYIYYLKNKKRTFKLRTIYKMLGWILCLLLMIMCIYSGKLLQNFENKRLLNALFMSLMRPMWSISICWVIFACAMGFGGIINKILSLRLLQVLSKLCYSILLVNFTCIYVMNFSRKTLLYFSPSNAARKCLEDTTVVLAVALLWFLLFEAPFAALQYTLLQKRKVFVVVGK